jgi:hypothetical protein
LREELESLPRSRGKVFQVPPTEWIQERLIKLQELPERNLERSASCSGIFLVPSDLSLCPAVIPNESFSAKGN